MKDEQAGENLSDAEKEKVMQTEAGRVLQKVAPDVYLIALTINGTKMDSVSFASHMEKLQGQGSGKIAFVIGGSLGLARELLQRANEEISFSDLTFPHQLARVILMEQIYRAYRIRSGAPYHK